MKYKFSKKAANSWKRIISMTVVCFMVFTMLPANALADTGGISISPFNAHVVNEPEYGSIVTGILQGQDVVIFSGGEITGTITVPVGRTLTLNGGTITGGETSGVLVNGGTLVMIDGTISANMSSNGGGGVRVANGGMFTMEGGTIYGNTATQWGGGGVFVYDGEFTMTGGTITENTSNVHGGGVAVRTGTFVMDEEAAIAKNTAIGRGGGVHLTNTAHFYMYGGVIEANNATQGGGVNTEFWSGDFDMKGGYIRNHDVNGYGGGVSIGGGGGTFTMTGGTIYDNKAGRGGGVAVRGDGTIHSTFNIGGDAEIRDNTARVVGGGVAVFLGLFSMDDDTIIKGNNANNGGGVWISASDVTIDGGIIYNNTAAVIGGGIVLQNYRASSLEIIAGTISHNTAANGGGIGFLLSDPNPTEVHFQAFLDVVTIGSGVVFEYNEATHGQFTNEILRDGNSQIRPGTVTLTAFDHAFNNYDIHMPCDCVCEGCTDCGDACNCDCYCDCYDFRIIFHMYGESDTYVVVEVNIGDTLDLTALAALEIPVNHIYGAADAPGWALWGWFDEATLATGIGRDDLDAQGMRNGFRRPAVGSRGFDLNAVITQAMIDDIFDAEGNLHLFVIWSLWGDSDDNDVVASFDATLINQYLFDRWLADRPTPLPPQYNVVFNRIAADVDVSGTITSFDATLINRYLFDRWLTDRPTPLPPQYNTVLGQRLP